MKKLFAKGEHMQDIDELDLSPKSDKDVKISDVLDQKDSDLRKNLNYQSEGSHQE